MIKFINQYNVDILLKKRQLKAYHANKVRVFTPFPDGTVKLLGVVNNQNDVKRMMSDFSNFPDSMTFMKAKTILKSKYSK